MVKMVAPLCLACCGVSRAGLPCDIYGNARTPCVAAHSTVRALYASYRGPLYQLKRHDNKTMDIMVNDAGYADSASQDSFCGDATCVMQRIYDQSPNANHLDPSPPCTSCTYGHGNHDVPGTPVDAMKHPIILNGHRVYGAWFETSDGYRNSKTTGVPTGNDEESMYMVTSGKHFNGECCFDYGNAEIEPKDEGDGTMETIYFGSATSWDKEFNASGNGPWVAADLENGMYFGGALGSSTNTALTHDYVTAMVKGRNDSYVLKGGDATSGPLKTLFDGPRPPPATKGVKPHGGYQPMKKEGSIILGIGGDNARGAVGTFYEGVMTRGFSTDAADEAVQANIIAAGYGSTLPGFVSGKLVVEVVV